MNTLAIPWIFALFLAVYINITLSQLTIATNRSHIKSHPPKDHSFTVRRLISPRNRLKSYKYRNHENNALNYFHANKEEEDMMNGPDAASLHTALGADAVAMFKKDDGVLKVKWPETTKYVYFKWKDYMAHFDAGRLNDAQKKLVVNLRKDTVYRLLEYVVNKLDPRDDAYVLNDGTQAADKYYKKIGSDTPSSDFDFSYVKWDKPEIVVKSLIKYQNKFVQIYNGYTLSVYDMNYYIGTAFIKTELFDTFTDPKFTKMKQLFTKLTWKDGQKTIYELGREFRSIAKADFLKYDKWLAHYVIIQKAMAIELGTMGIGENDFEIELLQFSEIFFYVFYELQHEKAEKPLWVEANSRERDQYTLYLKVLLYIINYYQDESYISNEGLHYMGDNTLSAYTHGDREDRIKIAILDNFAFITEYFVHAFTDMHKTDNAKLFYFWDRSSKYLVRIGDLIKALNIAPDAGVPGDLAELRPQTDEVGQALADLSETEAGMEGALLLVNWNTLSRLWLLKVDEKNIRGNVEMTHIIKPDGDVSTDEIPAKYNDIKDHIENGRDIWKEVLRRTTAVPGETGGIAKLWQKGTVYGYGEGLVDNGVWSKVFTKFRRDIDSGVDGGLQVNLKNDIKEILYNICGKYDFGTDKMKSAQRTKVHDDEKILKGIVHAYKKMARKGHKLDITTFEAYDYKYWNPFLLRGV